MVGFTFASRAFSFFFVFDYSGFTFKSACLDEVPRPPPDAPIPRPTTVSQGNGGL